MDCSDIQLYQDLTNGIMGCVNRDSFIVIYIYSDGGTINPYSFEVKLNGTVPVETDIDLNLSLNGNDGTSGFVFIPKDIEPGDYYIHVYVDGIEYISKYKIRILEGQSQIYDTSYPGELMVNKAWFVFGDEIFYAGGHPEATFIPNEPMWSFNMKTKKWTQKMDIPVQYIEPINLQWDDKGYVLKVNYEDPRNPLVNIWEYNSVNDTWNLIENYPGRGVTNLTAFVNNGFLYIGGGVITNGVTFQATYLTDFWAYNIQQKRWTQKRDIPYNAISKIVCCSSPNNKSYIFTEYKELWEYDCISDQWESKGRQTGGGPYSRYESSLIYYNDNLYVLGGAYMPGSYAIFIPLTDVWQYSLSSGTWKLKNFLTTSSYGAPAFVYNDKIYFGYFVEQYYSDGFKYRPSILEIYP